VTRAHPPSDAVIRVDGSGPTQRGHYVPRNVLWLVIYIEILILDVLYVLLLSRAPRYQRDQMGASP